MLCSCVPSALLLCPLCSSQVDTCSALLCSSVPVSCVDRSCVLCRLSLSLSLSPLLCPCVSGRQALLCVCGVLCLVLALSLLSLCSCQVDRSSLCFSTSCVSLLCRQVLCVGPFVCVSASLPLAPSVPRVDSPCVCVGPLCVCVGPLCVWSLCVCLSVFVLSCVGTPSLLCRQALCAPGLLSVVSTHPPVGSSALSSCGPLCCVDTRPLSALGPSLSCPCSGPLCAPLALCLCLCVPRVGRPLCAPLGPLCAPLGPSLALSLSLCPSCRHMPLWAPLVCVLCRHAPSLGPLCCVDTGSLSGRQSPHVDTPSPLGPLSVVSTPPCVLCRLCCAPYPLRVVFHNRIALCHASGVVCPCLFMPVCVPCPNV